MNQQTKRKIKNAAKTGGKYALKGVKLAGKGVLTVTELASKAVQKTAKSKDARAFIAKAGTIASTVAFTGPVITISAINYILHNQLLDKNVSPVEALMSTLGATEKIMSDVLDLAAVPASIIAKETEKLSQNGKNWLDR